MQQTPALDADASRSRLRASLSIIIVRPNEEDTITERSERLTQSAPEAENTVLRGGKDRACEPAGIFAQSHPNAGPVPNKNHCGSLIKFPTQ
jgi:hypothetical protein